ncbi:dystroglycan 1-like [Octopus vulgaris]|uniref:Dystroglycan 1 n=1 Tax=Octopus vulgaris TaxID=6645 RepID=A0AA36FRZ8_OCTVU|nr:dystroglycan 1-like [Octopus vulgaris]
MGRRKGISTTTSPSSAVTASSVAVLSSDYHHQRLPSDCTTPTTTTAAVSTGVRSPQHYHPYNNYSHRSSGCGGGGGSSGKSRKMRCYSENDNMTTTTDVDSDASSSSFCYSPRHNHHHHHHHQPHPHSIVAPANTALSVMSPPSRSNDKDTTRAPCCSAPCLALETLSSSTLLLPAASSPTHMAPHRRRFLSPLRLWTTLILCIALLMQPTFAEIVPLGNSMQLVTGGGPSKQLKLNDIQSYLKSLDKSKKGEANLAATTAAAAVHRDPVKDREPVSLMWGIGDTTAYVGRLFTYPLPNDAFKGEIKSFKVMEAGKTTLPRWLYFDVETRTFSGVPKPADIAQYYIEVVAQAEDQGAVSQFAKDVFSIHVTKESSKPATAAVSAAISSSSSKKNGKGSNSPPVVRCMPQEPETAFTLIVDADLDQLPPHGIVGLLKKLEHNLELVSEMFKVGPATTGNRPIPPVRAVAPDTSSSSTLVSGPGDTKTAKHPGVLVTWLVGCGRVEPQHMNVLQRVESISANGTLSELLGHGVVGWHVTNRQVPLPEKRVRRAAIMATPAVTDIAPTVMATRTRGHEGDGGMTHRVPTMESSLIQPTRTHPHSHKTHHRHTDGMTTLHPSTMGPKGGSTLKTKSLPDGTFTMTGGDVSMTGVVPPIIPTKPSTGMATSMPEYCSHARKLKPRIAHRIPVQEFEAGKRAYFSVPSDTFIDCKDPSDRLKLGFFLDDYKQIPPYFWLQPDPANDKSMIGLPMESNVGIHNMTVVAINSDGMTDYLDFLVKVLKNKKLKSNEVTHKIKMKFSMEYKKFMSNINSRLDLIDKIGKLYGDADASSVTVLEITEGSVEVSWTNNTLVGTKCPDDATKALFERLVDDKKQVKRSARKAMKPFKLQSAQIIPMGACAGGYINPMPSTTMAAATTPELKKQQSDDENDILISTVVPAVIIVSILLLALLVACILYRKKRKGKMSLSSASEHDAYSGKGAPVIFAEELEDKPTDCQRPLILDDEKPPHPPPEYQHSSSESTQSTPNQDRRRGGHRSDGGVNEPILGSQPYEPPPPVTASQGKKQPRPHVQPPYRSPPPYVPP